VKPRPTGPRTSSDLSQDIKWNMTARTKVKSPLIQQTPVQVAPHTVKSPLQLMLILIIVNDTVMFARFGRTWRLGDIDLSLYYLVSSTSLTTSEPLTTRNCFGLYTSSLGSEMTRSDLLLDQRLRTSEWKSGEMNGLEGETLHISDLWW